MGMNTTEEAPARRPLWKKPAFIVPIAIAVVVLLGGGIAGIVIANNVAQAEAAAAAAEKAAEEKAAEEKRQEIFLQRERDDALYEANIALHNGEAHYTESAEYGDSELRAELREALDDLKATVDSPESPTSVILNRIDNVQYTSDGVGTKEAAVIAAQEKRYEELAAQEGSSSTPSDGVKYCEYLRNNYTPETVLSILWDGYSESMQIDDAGVRVYCPEYEAALNLVRSGFYDGDHVVGTTIPAGTFRTVEAVKDCYWERNDGAGNILDNSFVGSAHQGVTVTIHAGEGFTSDGCGLWVPAG